MNVEVNWLAIVLATLSTMVVGSVWYTPKTFGKQWEKLARIDPKNRPKAGKAIGITLVVSFISAYVLAHVTFLSHNFFGNSFLQDALSTAFWAWLGFTAARFITHDAFENRPWKLTLMNVAHELVTFMVMGLVIGLLPPAL
jgi:ABC-type Fe3+ transport system permease subunit